MTLYLNILKLLLIRDNYNRYYKYIDVKYLKDNYPEVLKVLLCLERMFDVLKDGDASVEDLEASFFAQYPASDKAIFSALFGRISEAAAAPESIVELLRSLELRQKASELAFTALDVAEGKAGVEALEDRIKNYASVQDRPAQEEPEEFVSDDLETLYDSAVKEGGLSWRLKSLRRSLGPLRKGDFGFIFARPETGKTTFLASEVSYMAGQVERPILWINNEEQGEKVGLRCYEAALGAPLERILGDRKRATEVYKRLTGGHIRIRDDSGISRRSIESLCELLKPSLIVVDQLDKVRGFDADREDLLLGAIYQWARELAKEYAPVIGVSQADGSGEGMKWLNMGNVANAKTAKQAEADWILGIGVDYNDPPNVRGFQICKNKLVGGEESIPGMRHSHWEVIICPEIGRYEDINRGD